MSEGARRKPEVKRGELSWRGCEGRAGSREGGMESVGRREEEGNPMAAEHKRDKQWCFETKGFEPYSGGKLEGFACCLG